MMGLGGISVGGVRAPLSLPTLQLWIDSVTNVSGATGAAIDSIGDQSPFARTMSNTSGAGSRPVWADITTNAGADMFSSGTKNGMTFESGGDWLSLSGLDTAAAFTCPASLSVFHVTRDNHVNTSPNTAGNLPLVIIGTVGTTVTMRTQSGFSAGQPQYQTWEGASYHIYSATRTNLNDNAVHSVCWVHAGTNLKCYIDGTLDSSQTTAAYQTTNGFNALGGVSDTDAWEGGLAEVMVWNDTLSAAQVALLHSRAVGLWF